MIRRYTLALALGIGALYGLGALVLELASRVQPTPAFGSVFIRNGWLYALAGLAALVTFVFFASATWTYLENRLTGRQKKPWLRFRHSLTHLFMLVTLVLVYYPILHVVGASLDPNNSLFSFRTSTDAPLLVRAKVVPDLSNVSWENYRRLVDGFSFTPGQLGLILVAAASLMGFALTLLPRGQSAPRVQGLVRRTSPLALGSSVLLILFLVTPDQFAGRATESKFLLWVRNTLLVAGSTGFLSVALTATAGYAFARFKTLPGRLTLLKGFVFVQLFPGFLTLIAIYYLMSRLGLLNTLTGLVLAYSGAVISFGAWIYKGFLEGLGTALEEAALVDGATRWGAFVRILVPLSTPIFVFIFLMQFVGAYSEFILANLFLTGIDSWTVGIGLYSFTTGQFNTRWGIFSAASILGSLPILVIFYSFQHAFVSGYTSGAVKE